MDVKSALTETLRFSQNVVNGFLADVSDEDLKIRPVEGANSIAWQLAHLIASEASFGASLPGAKYPAVPESIKTCGRGLPTGNPEAGCGLPKTQLVEWFNRVREATIAALQAIDEKSLDTPNPNEGMRRLAPTFGSLFILANNHTMMHAGQWSVVRRKLKKPVLF